jgi:hypothetical protein
MPETIRLKTQVGVDREINIQLDQDFEQLEILSLKVRSEDVYTRMCADYGIVVGRVVANGGYGVPNVKVSVFVPLTEDDANNEIISTLYPYTSLTDVNEDGYRYNLLPYEQQYTGHIPTGTFPTRNDVLTNPAVIEVYDKYYKFTVKTNGSGDYMIMGVPVGTHTLVMDCDLSDIGPFSQSPQDLIRMGRASADQLDGVNFKSSTNLYSLPQIVNINQSVDVNPFWGQPEICQINIARNDFDLRSVGINIQPSAIFMGSLVTGIDDEAVEKSCKPPRDMGNLCNLSVGPGEIISVRQTIFQDTQGRPILEQGTLPQGGKVIDGDGTWVLDVPMNLNYVVTNEFGEQVFSQDPTVGIPTKGKYRFKVKYTQPTSFETEEIRRGYFLVPNIKEYGWVDADNDPAYIVDTDDINYKKFLGSYYFGTDWSGYTNQADAIACKDTFYEMEYNKVYTVSQHYDQYKKGFNRSKFIGIKEITDSSCASENNKYPATDGVQSFDFFVFLLNILLPINYYILLVLVPVLHVLAFIWPLFRLLFTFVYGVIAWIIYGICKVVDAIPGISLDCQQPPSFGDIFDTIGEPFKKITLPSISYPECQLCDCGGSEETGNNPTTQDVEQESSSNVVSPNADFFTSTNWITSDETFQITLAGTGFNNATLKTPVYQPTNSGYSFIDNLPIWETVNKFNLKSKYFDSDVYPGSNRIKVVVEPTLNGTNPNLFHYDNVMVLFVDPGISSNLTSGQLLSFQQSQLSNDPNPKAVSTGDTTGITGTTKQGQTIQVNYADPTTQTLKTVNYVLSGASSAQTTNYKFSSDIEYFQVITGTTYDEFVTNNSNTLSSSLYNQISQQITFFKNQGVDIDTNSYGNYLENWAGGNLGMIFLVRGVDPNSGRKKIKYDLSRIFGNNGWGNQVITGDFYLNIPVQPGLKNVRHDEFTDNIQNNSGYLYYPSYTFTAGTQYSAYTTNLQQYYSSLDQKQINVFKPTSNNNTLLTISMVNVGGSGELLAKQFTPNGVGYKGSEYIEGGSYVYYNPYATVTPFDGDNNNGMLPAIYFAPKYPAKNLTMYSQRLVMRSDRLPTGTQPEINENNNYAGQASDNLTYVTVTDNGNSAITGSASGAGGVNPTDNPDVTTGGTINKVIDSFSCAGMVDLSCYTNQNGEFIVLPSTNACNNNSGGEIVKNGCYVLVNTPILTLASDWASLYQWLQRFRMNFAICRGVLSHTFVNSWVNGSLFAFPFTSKVFFDSNNRPFNRRVSRNLITGNREVNYLFCGDLLMFEPTSNNFYYRSSPYNGTNFVGGRASISFSQPVNTKNILFPTTLLDMGPKYVWQSEVNKDPNYFGYQMNKFNSTSWSDDSNLLQLFVVSRLVNQSFLQSLTSAILGVGGVGALFSRREDRVDGDFAQMLQINSQYGIVPFTAENYPDDPNVVGDNPIYVGGDKNGGPVFGVFYSGYSENRDLISPRRIDRTFTGTTLVADYLGTKSQEVPFYKWSNNAWLRGEPTIFGSQDNEWYTYGGNPIVDSKKYQEFDRRLQPFFQGNNNLIQNAYGYIYQRNLDGTYNKVPTTPTNERTLTSAPWYFYFGLKRGKTAMDKYVQQYLGTEPNE